MRDIMTKLKLTVNETKTRVCKLPEEKFDFLGYTFGRCYSPKTGRAYIGTVPSQKRVTRICGAISEMTGRDRTLLDQEIVVAKLNRTMIGWANYLSARPIGRWTVTPAKGCVSGCAPSTKCGDREPGGFRRHPCTTCWASSALLSGRAISRGPHRDPFSESRMPETGLSGSMSGV
jgi:Group II intron, maturase-specific domain